MACYDLEVYMFTFICWRYAKATNWHDPDDLTAQSKQNRLPAQSAPRVATTITRRTDKKNVVKTLSKMPHASFLPACVQKLLSVQIFQLPCSTWKSRLCAAGQECHKLKCWPTSSLDRSRTFLQGSRGFPKQSQFHRRTKFQVPFATSYVCSELGFPAHRSLPLHFHGANIQSGFKWKPFIRYIDHALSILGNCSKEFQVFRTLRGTRHVATPTVLVFDSTAKNI